MKKAFITGISGQVGSYLAEILLEKGYEVHGLLRRSSSLNTGRIDHIFNDLQLHYGDLTDAGSIARLVDKIKPEEVYNLGAQSHVRVSFDIPIYTSESVAIGALNVLEAIKGKGIKFYQASSSELYGGIYGAATNETTPFHPRSPYAVAKHFAYSMTVNYREAYNEFACNGILFNTESPRRGETFVTKKIVKAAVRISRGLQDTLTLGNLDARRDWGFAGDYCINRDVPILTTRGWRFCEEVKKGDEIINFDRRNNRLSRDKVKEKIEIKSDGNKILLEGRGVHLNVTPEHRIIYQRKSIKSKGGWSEWKEIAALDFHDLLKNKALVTKYTFRLPHFQDYDAPDLENISDHKLYLIGALLAEGCLSAATEGGGTVVSISQSYLVNEKTATKISKIFHLLDLNASEKCRNDGVSEWRFDARSSSIILDWFDSSNVHIMPNWFYKLSRRQSRIVFEALMDCDGCWGSMTYVSKRSLLACDFQSIAHLAGYRTTGIHQRKSGVYNVGVIAKRKKYTYVTKTSRWNDGHKNVWCIKTSNGTIISRDNNCISISGNCKAMHLMLQQDKPDDYVIATGETHSVREFLDEAFGYLNLDWTKYVVVDSKYFRPTEVDMLLGDASKAKKILGWEPKVKFRELVKLMIDAEMETK